MFATAKLVWLSVLWRPGHVERVLRLHDRQPTAHGLGAPDQVLANLASIADAQD